MESREIIEAKRVGYATGKASAADDVFYRSHVGNADSQGCDCTTYYKEAAKLFPFPKRVVARKVVDSDGDEWTLEDGVFRNNNGGTWGDATSYWLTPEFVKQLASLVDNPTEEVEDTGDAS